MAFALLSRETCATNHSNMMESEGATVESETKVVKASPTDVMVDMEMKQETADGAKTEEIAVEAKEDESKETVEVAVEETKETVVNKQEENSAEIEKKKGTKRTPEEPSPPLSQRSSKRSRKSAESFQPENFAAPKDSVHIIEGRGVKLEDIPNVKEKIESFANSSEEIVAAHKFVFRANIGKPASNHRREHLLEFSGYLPAIVEGEDEHARDKSDEKIETKMTQKAYKLLKSELKMLCDVFDIDRSPASIDKDELIERLCDFLSAPDPELTNAAKKKGKSKTPPKKNSTSKKKKEEEVDEETEDEEESEEEAQQVKGMPSDKALRKWVKAYVTCFNTDKMTLKHAIETASDKFGVDISEKKGTIKTMLTEEM